MNPAWITFVFILTVVKYNLQFFLMEQGVDKDQIA